MSRSWTSAPARRRTTTSRADQAPNRWRGRLGALVIGGVVLLCGWAATTTVAGSPAQLRVTADDGTVLATVPLPDSGAFALRYRNSLYGTLAEERFVVTADGRLRLTGLAAEQLAVLEEYYAIDEPATRTWTGRMAWLASPAHVPVEERLRVAATDLGARTLLVAGSAPLRLWTLVGDDRPVVVLDVGPAHD